MWRAFTKYYFGAKTIYQIHSPLLFEFADQILERKDLKPLTEIEELRKSLLKDETPIIRQDFGAGSKSLQHHTTVSRIAKTAIAHPMIVQLLTKMVRFYQPRQILELGTSLGITTAYLASHQKNGSVITVEGDQNIQKIAQSNFNKLNLPILSIQATFDQFFAKADQYPLQPNFVFIDGHHEGAALIRYFTQILPFLPPNAILILDDIHWTSDMEQAWEVIKTMDQVRFSIDMFQIGIIFTHSKNQEPEHIRLIPKKFKPWQLKLK